MDHWTDPFGPLPMEKEESGARTRKVVRLPDPFPVPNGADRLRLGYFKFSVFCRPLIGGLLKPPSLGRGDVSAELFCEQGGKT